MSRTGRFRNPRDKQKVDYFIDIVKEHKTAMFRLAYSIVMNQQDAEDAVSEAVLKAYSHLKDLRKIKKMKSWLFRIVVNESRNCLQKRVPTQCIEEIENSITQEEFSNDLLDYVCQLDERFREVVILYYFEGFRTKEIAGILEITEGTVKSRLSRARQKLKQYIEFQE